MRKLKWQSYPKVRSALCAASQLPGERPTDVEDAYTPARQTKPDNDESEPVTPLYILTLGLFQEILDPPPNCSFKL